jgi:hypothetical protein
MQGFRNYNIEAMQREQLHVVDFPPQYGKSTPPLSPNSGKLRKIKKEDFCDGRVSAHENSSTSSNLSHWRHVLLRDKFVSCLIRVV